MDPENKSDAVSEADESNNELIVVKVDNNLSEGNHDEETLQQGTVVDAGPSQRSEEVDPEQTLATSDSEPAQVSDPVTDAVTVNPVSPKPPRKVMLFSSLARALDIIEEPLKSRKINTVLFVPYAHVDEFDEYVENIERFLDVIDVKLVGIHKFDDKEAAVRSAKAIFVGGGNTFLLLKRLYNLNLMGIIRQRVMEEGMVYIGTSAGANLGAVNICTTNDMPIVYPPSFDALGLVPFNINPHFFETPGPSFGETREVRITQYLQMENSHPVLALKNGVMLDVEGDKATIRGVDGEEAFLFQRGLVKYGPSSDVSFLLSETTYHEM